MEIYYQNIRGIRTKLQKLRESAALYSYDIYFLTETWLDGNIKSAELGLDNHKIHRCDRSSSTSTKKKGGGVLIAVDSKLPSRKINTKNNDIEQLFVLTNTPSGKLILGCVYFPPTSDSLMYQKHCEDIELLFTKYPEAKFILTGDYNLPNLEWKGTEDPIILHEKENDAARVILDMLNFLNLNQHNIISNTSNRILDLIMSNIHILNLM